MDTDKIRTGLIDFRTRSQAIDAAVLSGADAVDPAIAWLGDRNEAVRWSAIKILGELGDDRAVEPLIKLLAKGKQRPDILRALTAITGENPGDCAEDWERWQRGEEPAPSAEKPQTLSEADLLNAAVKDLPASFHGDSPQFTVDVVLSDGRSQQVWVDFSQTTPEGEPIVQLCTPCAPADKKRYEEVLKLNMSIPFGSIALAEMEGSLFFVMVDTHLKATVQPEDIAHSLTSLAAQGDAIEQALTGGNVH